MDKYLIKYKNKKFEISADTLASKDLIKIAENQYHIIHNNHSTKIKILNSDLQNGKIDAEINGKKFSYYIENHLQQKINELGFQTKHNNLENEIKAPMPGIVLSVDVQLNDTVTKGQNLIKLEAMKMENIIKSPKEGIIKILNIRPQDKVEKNQILMEIE
ncbi:MAG: hypothetical protein IT267_09805 [Saprospiraceae bacterium]|nr:hypothetical protein [Saprospiraceae bacterium]